MEKSFNSKNRFPLSELSPNEYPIRSSDDAMCVEIAKAIGETNMRFILARHQQLGMAVLNVCYASVKEYVRNGTCRSPARLFNALLTKELNKQRQEKGLSQ